MDKKDLDIMSADLIGVEYQARYLSFVCIWYFPICSQFNNLFYEVQNWRVTVLTKQAFMTKEVPMTNLRRFIALPVFNIKMLKKIKIVVRHAKNEYDKISYCPDCGTTLTRKSKFFDIGGGD